MTNNISEELKNQLEKLHEALYDMLCTFDDYCAKHEIKYFLIAGTLLGAIRHGDFIPWDDDVDIGMTRQQYEKLINTFKIDPMPGFFLQHYSTDKNYLNLHAKLRKNNTYFEEIENKFQKNTHKGIFIDIFPFDRLSQSAILHSTKLWCTQALTWIVSSKRCYPRKSRLKNTALTLIRWITTPIPSRTILRIIDSIQTSLSKNSNTYYCHHLFGIKSHKKSIILSSEFDNFTAKKIKTRDFPVPVNFHQILSRSYGDYMTLPEVSQRKPKHAIKFSTDTQFDAIQRAF